MKRRHVTRWDFFDPKIVLSIVLLIVLCVKYFHPLFRFSVPLGFDPGIYRYLFVHFGNAFAPFSMPQMDPWAYEHPLGLFLFSTVLLKAGIPVDALIGWVWNVLSLSLLLTLVWIFTKKKGRSLTPYLLLAAILSQATFDGFTAMFYKTTFALLWMILSFYFLERKSLKGILFGLLTIITHHQTGLLYILVLLIWGGNICMNRQTILGDIRTILRRSVSRGIVILSVVALTLAFILYLPVLEGSVLQHLPALFSLTGAPGGDFPEPQFYIKVSGILLFFGLLGFVRSIRSDELTLWHLSVIVSAAFVVFRLIFYRRFFLHLDFFLIPFAAMGMKWIWEHMKEKSLQAALIFFLLAQFVLSLQATLVRAPKISAETFNGMRDIAMTLPMDATIIALENESAPFIRGWLPYNRFFGPGIFQSWTYDEWEGFLLGSHNDRLKLLSPLRGPVYLFVSPRFHDYYLEFGRAFLADECIHMTQNPFLYSIGEDCVLPSVL